MALTAIWLSVELEVCNSKNITWWNRLNDLICAQITQRIDSTPQPRKFWSRRLPPSTGHDSSAAAVEISRAQSGASILKAVQAQIQILIQTTTVWCIVVTC